MRTIWEFTVGLDSPQVVYVPENAVLLNIAPSNGFAKMWFEVDQDAQSQPRTFIPVWTGSQLDERYGKYVGTVVFDNLARHYYEVK